MKIMYIAGYGRSGSTALGTILGNHPQLIHVGEASFLFDDWNNPRRVCACGMPYSECSFWGDLGLEPQLARDYALVTRRVERLEALPRTYWNAPDSILSGEYRTAQERVYRHVAERTGKSIIVDSSKSARATIGRALALRRFAGFDVRVLHLVRNGLSTLSSFTNTGSNWGLEDHRPQLRYLPLRVAIGWTVANAGVSCSARVFGADRFLRLRYEDFVADPEGCVKRLCQFVGVDCVELAARVQRQDEFPVGHTVGGNRVRLTGSIKLRSSNEQHPELSLGARLPMLVCGGWLLRSYGYS